MIRKLKSLFIIEEDTNDTNTGKDSVDNDQELPVDEHLDSHELLLDELGSLDDFDEKLAAALEGEYIDDEGNLDDKIIEELLLVVEKNNIEGFDYFEYKQSLKALEKMPMNEATKYRSAFATAATMGITLEKLLESAEFYLGILDSEDEKFTTSSEKKRKENIGGKEQKILELKASIEEKRLEIQRLEKEIAKNEGQISDLERDVKVERVEIEKTRNNFKVSFDYLRKQFTDDISKMKQYLK